MTKHRVVSLAIGIILLFAIPAISKSFLVPGDATTIQGAIDMAEDTDTVSVAAGTYSENIFMFDQNVSIIAVNGPEVTIIEPADPNSPLFTIYTSAPVRGSDNRIYSPAISGFTITGGGDSHVIYLDGQSQVTITGNIFHDNIPDKVYDKAVILCQGDSSAQVISHNIFYDNYGLCCVSVPNGHAQIIGNTFVGNRVAFLSSSETCVAINNIVTSCLNMGIDGAFGQNDYNLFWSNVLDYGWSCNAGPNDLHSNPQFAGSADHDYSLIDTSPCIDAGHPDPIYNDPDGSRCDIGALPYVETIVYICGDANGDDAANVGDAVTLINYVFKGGPPPDPECLGDANGDAAVNVGDAVFLINFVFNGGPTPIEGCCP